MVCVAIMHCSGEMRNTHSQYSYLWANGLEIGPQLFKEIPRQ